MWNSSSYYSLLCPCWKPQHLAHQQKLFHTLLIQNQSAEASAFSIQPTTAYSAQVSYTQHHPLWIRYVSPRAFQPPAAKRQDRVFSTRVLCSLVDRNQGWGHGIWQHTRLFRISTPNSQVQSTLWKTSCQGIQPNSLRVAHTSRVLGQIWWGKALWTNGLSRKASW